MHEPADPCPPHAFDEPASRPAVRRPLPVIPQHVDLRVRLDPATPTVAGTVHHRVLARRRFRRFTLDAVDIDVTRVTLADAPLDFVAHATGLDVELPEAAEPGDGFTISVEFSARPSVGLYFVPATDTRPAQAWTQGAMEDHQHWFPCFDAPQHMVTSEVRATVPKPYTALSNGVAVGREDADEGWQTFHWKHDTLHALYLMTLVVDEVEEVRGQHGEVTLHHYVPAGREADAETLFERVGEMLDFFAELTGRPYPYPRYGHAFLRDFMWGGMENTTLTSLTDTVLVAGEHREEEDVERLIAHELAHQWFGDLIAPRGWPEIWLNESFATYFEQLCMAALNGQDDLARRMAGERSSYLSEANERYARAVVTRTYAHPYVLFDRHAYEKGCLVLHTLRDQLGDATFFRGVQLYVKRCAGTAAETADLRRAFEDVSGEDLADFFEHWVYAAAHPKAKVSWSFSERVGLELLVERTDETDCEFEVDVGVGDDDGHTVHRMRVRRGRSAIVVRADRAPRWVAVDPECACLFEVDESAESDASLRARLRADTTSVMLRQRTASLLGRRGNPRNTAALLDALRGPSVTVGIAAAKALGEHRSPTARDALAAVVEDVAAPWRIRAAAGRALGVGADEAELKRFEALLSGVDRHRVRCGIIGGLGHIRCDEARSLLRGQVEIESPKSCVAAAAIGALARQETPDAIEDIERHAREGRPRHVRQAAIVGLGRLAKLEATTKAERRRVRELLEGYLRDDSFFVRISAVAGLKRLGRKRSKAALKRAHGAEQFAFIRRRIREALGALER